MKRKIVSILALCALVSTTLFGCGSQSAGTAEGSASEGSASEGTAESAAGGEEEYVSIDWFMSNGQVPSPWNLDMPVLKEISERTGVVLEANTPAQDADTKLNLLMANGQLPDVISITNADLYSELIKSGQVWDIQEFFETYLPDANIINGYFPEDIKEAITTRDGGWYAIPSHITSVDNKTIWPVPDDLKEYYEGLSTSNQFTIMFNRPMMEEYGISVEDVKTEKGLLEALNKIKDAGATNKDGASVYPLMIHGDLFWQFTSESIYNLFGAMPVDKDGNYQSQYYSDQYRDGLEFLNECYREGVLDSEIMTMDEATVVALTNDDRVFCYLAGTAANGIADRMVTDENGNNTDEYVWMCPGAIEWESGYKPAIGVSSAVNQGWMQTFISKDCENPEAIARFIDEMMFTKEGLTLINYGIEGTDWNWNDKGLIERTVEGQKAYENAATTGVGAFWMLSNTDFGYSVDNVTSDIEDEVEAVLGMDPATYIYDTIALQMPSGYIEPGSSYNTTEIEVKSYVPQQLAKLILAGDDAEFDSLYNEFIEQLDKLGLRELDAYKNEFLQKNYETYGYTLKAIN